MLPFNGDRKVKKRGGGSRERKKKQSQTKGFNLQYRLAARYIVLKQAVTVLAVN